MMDQAKQPKQTNPPAVKKSSKGKAEANQKPHNNSQPPAKGEDKGSGGNVNNDGNQKGANKQKNNQPQPGNRRRRDRKKLNKTDRKNLSEPQVIIDRILERSTFKVPNLSDKVQAKFSEDAYYRRAIGNIIYKSTIDHPTLNEISAFPYEFKGQVNIHPSATTSLECIYHKPEHALRRGWGKKEERRQAKKIQLRKAELQKMKLEQQQQAQIDQPMKAITAGPHQDDDMQVSEQVVLRPAVSEVTHPMEE